MSARSPRIRPPLILMALATLVMVSLAASPAAAKKYTLEELQGLARDSLRAPVGTDTPADIDVDDDEFAPPDVVDRPVTFYEDLARAARPDVKMLESAVKAKLALADLERRKEYPDLVIIAGAVFARAGRRQPRQRFL
jgi:outer membrane protein TolC